VFESKYSAGTFPLPILILLVAQVVTGQNLRQAVVPLKNWATPLYWQTEEIRSPEDRLAAVEALLSANASNSAPPFAPANR
jgi:hypothetical protein